MKISLKTIVVLCIQVMLSKRSHDDGQAFPPVSILVTNILDLPQRLTLLMQLHEVE